MYLTMAIVMGKSIQIFSWKEDINTPIFILLFHLKNFLNPTDDIKHHSKKMMNFLIILALEIYGLRMNRTILTEHTRIVVANI